MSNCHKFVLFNSFRIHIDEVNKEVLDKQIFKVTVVQKAT